MSALTKALFSIHNLLFVLTAIPSDSSSDIDVVALCKLELKFEVIFLATLLIGAWTLDPINAEDCEEVDGVLDLDEDLDFSALDPEGEAAEAVEDIEVPVIFLRNPFRPLAWFSVDEVA